MSISGGLHHVGITVRDLEESVEWYERVFDVSADFRASGSGEELSRAVGVPDARLELAFLRIGGSSIELLVYDNDRIEEFDRTSADVGSTHVCLHVDDIDKSYSDLLDRGVTFFAPPLLIEEGPLAGSRFAYFKDPNGVTLELFETAHDH